jgi:hypothetical protein
MSRKGAETQRDAHGFALTRWVNACLLASASSLRLCAFARHPIAGFRVIRVPELIAFVAHGAQQREIEMEADPGRCPGLAYHRAFGPRCRVSVAPQRRFLNPPVFNCVWYC